MRRTLAVLLLLPMVAHAQVDPTPRDLIAQADVDDSDVENEETLEDLQKIEIAAQDKSVAQAVLLSFIPGAGWGLIYADKKAQSTVPFVLSAAGYAMAGLYYGGLFDESTQDVCRHVRDEVVGFEECGYYKPKPRGEESRHLDPDPRSPGDRYFETRGDYSVETVGENVDGADTGLVILIATYAATTLLGAVWAGLEVADHNEKVRKEVEATVQAPTPTPIPVVAFDGDRGYLGLQIRF